MGSEVRLEVGLRRQTIPLMSLISRMECVYMRFSILSCTLALALGASTQVQALEWFGQAPAHGSQAPGVAFNAPQHPVAPVGHQVYYGSEEACAGPHCGPCGEPGGCSKWLPGTGAFGGDSPFAATLEFNQDTFFGFYANFTGAYAINELTDITFYSILWTSDFFAQGPGGLNGPIGIDSVGLWTEFGGGLNFKFMEGALNINPQIGILNGALLSGFGSPKTFEGVVPNLTINYSDTFYESEFYMGYYLATRGDRDAANDYLHWWFNTGIKPWGDFNDWRQILSTGVHYEQLRRTGVVGSSNLYQWLGPYVQFALPNGLSARFSAGWDVDVGNFGDDFYKVNIVYSF
jgi:hypothetical protein